MQCLGESDEWTREREPWTAIEESESKRERLEFDRYVKLLVEAEAKSA